jgi:hypothetical protein
MMAKKQKARKKPGKEVGRIAYLISAEPRCQAFTISGTKLIRLAGILLSPSRMRSKGIKAALGTWDPDIQYLTPRQLASNLFLLCLTLTMMFTAGLLALVAPVAFAQRGSFLVGTLSTVLVGYLADLYRRACIPSFSRIRRCCRPNRPMPGLRARWQSGVPLERGQSLLDRHPRYRGYHPCLFYQ